MHFKKIIFFLITIYSFALFADKITKKDQEDLNKILNAVIKKIKQKQQPQTILKNIKVWAGKTSTRIAIYPSNTIKFKYNLLHGKDGIDRIYIDLLGTKKGDFSLPQLKHNTFFKGIRLGNRKNALRIVLDVGKVEKYNVFVMQEPWRIVIDYYGNQTKKKIDLKEIEETIKTIEKPKKTIKKTKKIAKNRIKTSKTQKKNIKTQKETEENDFVVVIDPGHGGKDPGTSYSGVKEKTVVLKLAKIIKKKAQEIKGLKIVLTRNKDKFIPLEERAAIANEHNGDLFISIHANSFKKDKTVHGIEIYHLDNRRDSYTNKLARVENKLTGKNSMLNTILVDMTMSYYIKDSLDFATSIGKRIKKTARKNGTFIRDYTKGALFYVLVGARMPSMLIETGFLSNKKERKLLQNKKYLQQIADDILNGIVARIKEMKSRRNGR